jgi:acyl-CoA synthetase (AMP-forming)/AMP-acid ligase II
MHLLDLLSNGSSNRGWFIFDDGSRVSTAQLWADSARSASWFRHRIGPGSCAAAILTPSAAALAAIVGAFRSGSVLASLPIPARGVSATAYLRQVEDLLRFVGARTVLVESDYVPLMVGMDADVASFEQTLTGDPIRHEEARSAEFIQFSSGTTAQPAGIRLSLDAMGENVEATLDALSLHPGDSTLSWLPLSHDMGLVGMCLCPWAGGATRFAGGGNAFLGRPEGFLARPLDWLRRASEEQVSITAAPCFALELVLRRVQHQSVALDLSRVRVLIVGAELVRPTVLRAFESVFAEHGFRPIAFSPAYGLAEATLAVSIVRPDEHWRALRFGSVDGVHFESATGEVGQEFVSCGRPLADTEIRIDDGVISIRSPSLFHSCIGRAAPDLADGWFATSDLGQMNNGELVPFGRCDDVISVAGRNVDAGLVALAAETVDPIRAGATAAVLGPDGRLRIVTETTAPPDVSTQELLGRVRRAVADAVGIAPTELILVRAGSLPKTPSGKPQRFRVVAELLAESLDIVGIARTR